MTPASSPIRRGFEIEQEKENSMKLRSRKSKRLIAAERAYDWSGRRNYPNPPAIATWDEILRAAAENDKYKEQRRRYPK